MTVKFNFEIRMSNPDSRRFDLMRQEMVKISKEEDSLLFEDFDHVKANDWNQWELAPQPYGVWIRNTASSDTVPETLLRVVQEHIKRTGGEPIDFSYVKDNPGKENDHLVIGKACVASDGYVCVPIESKIMEAVWQEVDRVLDERAENDEPEFSQP